MRLGRCVRLFAAFVGWVNGIIITKRQALALSKNAADFEAMARGLSARTLSARLAPAPARGKE